MRLFEPKDKAAFFIITIILLALLSWSLVSGGPTIPEKLAGALAMPVQRAGTLGAESAKMTLLSLFGKQNDEYDRVKAENDMLKQQMADYEHLKAKNEQYKAMLGIKEDRSDIQIVDTVVIGRDPLGQFGYYLIDKGEKDGVKPDAAVIGEGGLAGKVVKVYSTSALIASVLSPEVRAGAYEAGSKEDGVACGDTALCEAGKLKLDYLQPDTRIKEGAVVMTSGVGGVFPKGLPVGTVTAVNREATGVACFAELKPFVEPSADKYLFVVTAFEAIGE